MRFLIPLVALLLTGCVKQLEVRDEYKGEDAGRVAIGIGATTKTNYDWYIIHFRNLETKAKGRFVYHQNNLFRAHKRDYETQDENGVVWYFNLRPGRYEIFNYTIYLHAGTSEINWYSRKDFSIPFTIRPNETTYLGNYQANLMTEKGAFGVAMPNGAKFVVTDREKRDLELVRNRIPNVAFGSVNNATPKPEAIGTPLFVGQNAMIAQSPVPVSEVGRNELANAIKAFEEVCLRTAPSFLGAVKAAGAFGVSELSDEGYMKMGFNKDKSLGVQVKENNECVITTPEQASSTLTRQFLQVVSQHASEPPSDRVPAKASINGVRFIFQHDREGGEAFVMLKAND